MGGITMVRGNGKKKPTTGMFPTQKSRKKLDRRKKTEIGNDVETRKREVGGKLSDEMIRNQGR